MKLNLLIFISKTCAKAGRKTGFLSYIKRINSIRKETAIKSIQFLKILLRKIFHSKPLCQLTIVTRIHLPYIFSIGRESRFKISLKGFVVFTNFTNKVGPINNFINSNDIYFIINMFMLLVTLILRLAKTEQFYIF